MPFSVPRQHRLARRLGGGLAAALAVALAMPAAQASPLANMYRFVNVINQNDVTFNQELGINNSGVIAGYFGSGAHGHPNKGYTVVNTLLPIVQDDFIAENFLDSIQTQVIGINNRALTVGFWSNQNTVSGANNNFGFVNAGGVQGVFININNPATGKVGGIRVNNLLGINDRNTAVGFYVDATGASHGYTFSVTHNTFSANIDDPKGVGMTTAAAINNLGEIVGFYGPMGAQHGFLLKNGVFTTIDGPNATSTNLTGLNNRGIAVGFEVDKAGKMHGLVCSVATATCTTLDDPKGIGTTTFNGINDLGQIVGFYVNGADNTIGLLANPIVLTSFID
jgi:hypothetical protein